MMKSLKFVTTPNDYYLLRVYPDRLFSWNHRLHHEHADNQVSQTCFWALAAGLC